MADVSASSPHSELRETIVEGLMHERPSFTAGREALDSLFEQLEALRQAALLMPKQQHPTDGPYLYANAKDCAALHKLLGSNPAILPDAAPAPASGRDGTAGAALSPADSPNGEQTRAQILERLAFTVKEAIDGGSFDGTLFESQVSGTLWLLYGEKSPAISPVCKCGYPKTALTETVTLGESVRPGWKCESCGWWNWLDAQSPASRQDA